MSTPSETPADFTRLYGHLPLVYQPHDFAQRGARTKWRAAMEQALPALYIPASLELRQGHHYQPPRFNFGWKLTAEDISAIVQLHGLNASDFVGANGDPARLPAQARLNQHLASTYPGSQYPSIRIDTILAGESTPNVCITLADNHRSGNARPSRDAIDAVRKFLGLAESKEPGWYLDSTWSHWQWKSSDEIIFTTERQGRTSQDRRR